ncbi:hypothetical protein DSM112329_02493 [Paraconexibacter sp. AEG42_29]|uniref:Mce/MlaD domain-containing protein n=1 Tax=Paraconexibacter sp. AEG42_29 TaxID=2997339 RepID=A0AAU7AVG8_9ACTN
MLSVRRDVFALIGLIVVSLLVGGYILGQQRLRFPFIEDTPVRMSAELSTAQAVTPGQGQTIRVSGVRIGDIGKVELRDGRAFVELVIDREYEDLIRTDATALLRPKTGLKDMFLDVNPGSEEAPQAKGGFTIPVRNTLPDVNPDEILAGLDHDVRGHVAQLLKGASTGLDGRGADLRSVLKRFEPTHRSLARVAGTVKARRVELRRLVSSLADVNTELARRDDDLAEVIGESSKVFRTLASTQDGIAASIRALPTALRSTRTALTEADRLAVVLKPASERLLPVPDALKRANDSLAPLARQATPQLRSDIRPFVRAARPVAADLRPASRDLAAAEPGLTRSLKVVNNLVNMLAYNPGGREGPDKAGRNEGYLFFLAWLGHQSLNLFSQSDAHGVFRPIVLSAPCQLLAQAAKTSPLESVILGVSGVLENTAACGEASGAAEAKR